MTSGAPALQAPLSAVKKQRLERKVNYEKNKQNTAKWLNQVKKNRESEYVDYTIEENRTKGATLASMATEFQPKDSLEQEIEKALIKDGMATEKDIMEKEKQDLLQLDPEEMKRRLKQMSKLKTLLFRQELKNKRLARIKSKLYHKIKRKAKEKDEKKLLEELELIDPQAAKEYRDRIEEKRVEERISLRHGSTSKFAQSLKRYGKFTNERNKEAYFDMMRQHEELKKKTRKVNDFKGDDDSEVSSDSEEDNITLEKLKAEALAKINQEVSESEDEQSDSNDEGGFDEDKLQKKEAKAQLKKQNKKTGIMGMKFMQKADNIQKELLKEKSKMLIDEINKYGHEGEGEEDDEDEESEGEQDQENDQQPKGSESKQKFKGENSKTTMPSNIVLDNEDVKQITAAINKKAEKVEGAVSSTKGQDHIGKFLESSNPLSADQLIEQWQGSVNKLAGTKRPKNALTFDSEKDLKDFNIDQIKNRKRIKFEELEDEEEEENNRKIYVTNEDMAKEEFEQQKQNLIEDQMEQDIMDEDKKNDKPMDGWGSWAGEGLTKSRTEIMKEQKRRERKIKEIKDKRKDAKKANVIINESRDKKFTKYLVSELPHPFKSAGQFEQLMKVPIGKEWNTIASYKRLIQPEILLKAGKIIKPLKYRKDISLKAVEALVQNRKDPSRPAAKF